MQVLRMMPELSVRHLRADSKSKWSVKVNKLKMNGRPSQSELPFFIITRAEMPPSRRNTAIPLSVRPVPEGNRGG